MLELWGLCGCFIVDGLGVVSSCIEEFDSVLYNVSRFQNSF